MTPGLFQLQVNITRGLRSRIMLEMSARSGNRSARNLSSAVVSDEPRRILAIDYGTKRVGLAISDDLQCTARPLLILERTNRGEFLKRLRSICREYGVARILLGHPLHLSGDSSPMAEETSRFAARLQKDLGIDVELSDERLTSWEARQTLRDADMPSRRKASHIDDVAAAILLREYLNRKRASDSESAGGEA